MVDSTIQQRFADAIFSLAWSDYFEQDGCAHETPWGAGAEITDYAPKTPDCVYELAGKVLADIEADLWREDLVAVYENNIASGTHYKTPTLSDFGWYLGTEWMGCGVCWQDNHPPHGLSIGWGQLDVQLDAADPNKAYIYGPYDTHATVTLEEK